MWYPHGTTPGCPRAVTLLPLPLAGITGGPRWWQPLNLSLVMGNAVGSPPHGPGEKPAKTCPAQSLCDFPPTQEWTPLPSPPVTHRSGDNSCSPHHMLTQQTDLYPPRDGKLGVTELPHITGLVGFLLPASPFTPLHVSILAFSHFSFPSPSSSPFLLNIFFLFHNIYYAFWALITLLVAHTRETMLSLHMCPIYVT